jgi:hypothetical protein
VPQVLPSAKFRGNQQGHIFPSAAPTLSKTLHSVKSGFAECQTLGKARHSAKLPLGKRGLTRDGGHLSSNFAACQPSGIQQKNYFLKIYFDECQH